MAINLRHFRPRAANARPRLALDQTQCWEDEAVVVEHLGGPGPVGAVIEGADSVLALALSGAEVVAWGTAGERALLELKLVGTRLRHPEYLQLLGLLEGGRRLTLYHQVRGELSSETRRYWDQHEPALRVGLLGLGRFEQALDRLRKRVLPWVLGPRLDALLQVSDLAEQRALLATLRGSRRWRALDQLAPAGLRAGLERALDSTLVHDCGPVLWVLLGHYPTLAGCGRRYLLPEHYEALGVAGERIRIVHAPPSLPRMHWGHGPVGDAAKLGLSWGSESGKAVGGIALRGAGFLSP